jgi:hypothetical protein
MAGAIVVEAKASTATSSTAPLQVLLLVQELDLFALSDASLADFTGELGEGQGPIYGYDPLPYACGRDSYQRAGFELSLMLVAGIPVAFFAAPAHSDHAAPPPSLIWHPTGRLPNVTLIVDGASVLLRIINAAPGRPYMLALGTGSDTTPRWRQSIVLTLVAIDGIDLPIGKGILADGLPLAAAGVGINISGGLLLPPGGRYDILSTAIAAIDSEVYAQQPPTLWGNSAHCASETPACPGLSPFPIVAFVVVTHAAVACNANTNVTGNASSVQSHSSCNAASNNDSTTVPRGDAAPDNPPDPVAVAPTISSHRQALLRHIGEEEVANRRRFVLSEQRESQSAPGDDGGVNRDIDPLSLTATGFYINNRTFDPKRIDVPGVLLGSAGAGFRC